MPNNKNLVLYILVSSLILIVPCLVLVLPRNDIMQWNQMLYEEGNFSLDMSIIVSYTGMIPSSWLFMIASFCIYRALTKYQLTFKKLCCNIQQSYSSLEFNFTGATMKEMSGNFTSSVTITTTTTISTTTTRKQHHKKSSRRNMNRIPIPEAKAIINTVPQTATSDLVAATATSTQENFIDSEWIVYENKKAKRSSLPAMSKNLKQTTTDTPVKHRESLKTPIIDAPANVATNKIILTNLEKRKRLQIKSLLPLRHACNNNYDEDVSDMPFLVSDNDTDSQASIESPCLSARELPSVQQQPQQQQQQKSYYSPFSTGFDFGVSSLTTPTASKDETKFYPSRLDDYFASQAPYNNVPSVESISNYTPSNSRAYNILKLLNPSNDHIKTTITPTAFKYFDDMLISNSLYKYQKEDDLFLKNKREWNNFAR